VPIESIKEIRVGKNTEVLRTRALSSGHTEDSAFSILYGDDFESLDLVASTPEEANIWVTGLNALVGAHKCKYLPFTLRVSEVKYIIRGFIICAASPNIIKMNKCRMKQFVGSGKNEKLIQTSLPKSKRRI
jgi:hypothetical protein